jgi:hypothetical protein
MYDKRHTLGSYTNDRDDCDSTMLHSCTRKPYKPAATYQRTLYHISHEARTTLLVDIVTACKTCRLRGMDYTSMNQENTHAHIMRQHHTHGTQQQTTMRRELSSTERPRIDLVSSAARALIVIAVLRFYRPAISSQKPDHNKQR